MADQTINRRLAAILAADVVNYTRMMNADETTTMEFWWTYRNEVIDPTIEKHQGLVVT